jgi:type II secretory pathway pseudopilin PulG
MMNCTECILRRCARREQIRAGGRSRAGITFIEVLITIIISAIAVLAAGTPLVAERTFWSAGKRQTDAQRDAQLVLRAIARAARESASFQIVGNAVTFHSGIPPAAPNCTAAFTWSPGTGQLITQRPCSAGPITLSTDVASFLPQQIQSNLVQISVQVVKGQQSELLVTDLFLRNGA